MKRSFELAKHHIPQRGTLWFVDEVKADRFGVFVDPCGSFGSEMAARQFIAERGVVAALGARFHEAAK